MDQKAEKAYKTYFDCVRQLKTVKRVARNDLNTLYNISCRIARDGEYAALIESACPAGERCLNELIESFFGEYNNLYGLEIRDNLTEFLDPELASGSYFIIDSYRKDDTGRLTELAPTDFSAGETAYVRVSHKSHESSSPVVSKKLSLIAVGDGGETFTKSVENTSSIDFELSLDKPGYFKFKVLALDKNGECVPGSETAYGGIVFSREEIRTYHEPPHDLSDFWDSEIRRLMNTDPRDSVADKYNGRVETLYGMPEKNRFSLKKLDKEYIRMLEENKQPSPTEEELSEYDVYEITLKCPGPTPATGYVSIPKNAKKASLPIYISYDGYSIRSPAPFIKEGYISLHCSHHGYELGHPDTYYAKIRETVGGNYCLGNGKINSGFEDIHDCYPLYIMLRDLQLIRFLTDKSLSFDIEGLSDVWCGEVILWGSSMGGYQTIGIGALTSIMKRYLPYSFSLTLEAGSPAFADVAGHTGGRVQSSMFTYRDGADYFDTAILATLIDSPISIFRASLGDEICTATSMSAIYNMIPENVKKEIRYVQNSSHGYIPEEDMQRWYVYKNY